MPGKIDIYNLGELGVDVVKSPLHSSDGDLIQAQNATPDPAGLEGGIRKRDGMAKLNTVALDGAVEGATAIPLPVPDAASRRFYAAVNSVGATWKTALGGITGWANATRPAAVWGSANVVAGVAATTGCLTYKGRIYYPGVPGGGAPPLRVFDGTSDNELCRIPAADTTEDATTYDIGQMWIHRGSLYLTAGPSGKHSVFVVDIVTGAVTRVGEFLAPAAGHGAAFGVSFLDRIFVGYLGDGGSGVNGKIRWLRNGEESFTLERTLPVGDYRGYVHGAVYKGNLYVGTGGSAGTAPIVERRTPDGTWSTSLTGPDAATGEFVNFVVFDGNLYCLYVSNASGGILLVKKFDGTSWTTDFDITATLTDQPFGMALATEDALYFTFTWGGGNDGFVLRRTLAGAWSVVLSDPDLQPHFGFLEG